MGEKKGTAVDAEGSGGPIQQVAVGFCGPQLDPAGYGRPEGLAMLFASRTGSGYQRRAAPISGGLPSVSLGLAALRRGLKLPKRS